MKLRDLWSPMSDLNQAQKDVSNSVVGGSLALLGVLMVAAMPLAANAQRMGGGYEYGGGGGGYSLPGKPVPAPAPAPVRPAPAPAPAPAPQPAPRPAPAPQPTYQPPAPRPQPQPQVTYGTFRPFGPLPAGRVNVQLDGSFEQGTVFGYTVYTQDNGPEGNDQMIIDGPEGREQVWINCWVTEEWKSFGPNSEEFIHGVVSMYCDWD